MKWIFVCLLFLSCSVRDKSNSQVTEASALVSNVKENKSVQENKGYKLKIYKSLVYKNHATEIAHYLKADRKAAKKIREVVENGKMVSGYYMMAPLSNGVCPTA